MALTDSEIQEVKNRMGYGSMTSLALPYIDTALVFETVVQQNLNTYGESYIRVTVLPNLRQLDIDIFAARTRFGIKELVGDVVFDTETANRQLTQLGELKQTWRKELAKTVRIPLADDPGQGRTAEVY